MTVEPWGYNLGGSILSLWEGMVGLVCFWKSRPAEGTHNQNIFLECSAVSVDFRVGAAEFPAILQLPAGLLKMDLFMGRGVKRLVSQFFENH